MVDVRKTSLEKLLRLVMEYRLFSDYQKTPTCVRLHRGAELLSFDPEEARLYLLGLVQGYQQGRQHAAVYLRRVA